MKALAVLLSLSLAACSSVGSTQLKQANARPADCKLDIYSSVKEINRPYEPVCIIDAKTGTTAFDDKTASGAVKLAMPKACACGADAILIEGMETNGMTFMTWGEGKAMLKGIRYK
jgi:hypothetical protein